MRMSNLAASRARPRSSSEVVVFARRALVTSHPIWGSPLVLTFTRCTLLLGKEADAATSPRSSGRPHLAGRLSGRRTDCGNLRGIVVRPPSYRLPFLKRSPPQSFFLPPALISRRGKQMLSLVCFTPLCDGSLLRQT